MIFTDPAIKKKTSYAGSHSPKTGAPAGSSLMAHLAQALLILGVHRSEEPNPFDHRHQLLPNHPWRDSHRLTSRRVI